MSIVITQNQIIAEMAKVIRETHDESYKMVGVLEAGYSHWTEDRYSGEVWVSHMIPGSNIMFRSAVCETSPLESHFIDFDFSGDEPVYIGDLARIQFGVSEIGGLSEDLLLPLFPMDVVMEQDDECDNSPSGYGRKFRVLLTESQARRLINGETLEISVLSGNNQERYTHAFTEEMMNTFRDMLLSALYHAEHDIGEKCGDLTPMWADGHGVYTTTEGAIQHLTDNYDTLMEIEMFQNARTTVIDRLLSSPNSTD